MYTTLNSFKVLAFPEIFNTIPKLEAKEDLFSSRQDFLNVFVFTVESDTRGDYSICDQAKVKGTVKKFQIF